MWANGKRLKLRVADLDVPVESLSNPASRISKIIDLAAASPLPHVYSVWRDVFNIPEEFGKNEAYVEVSQRLIWLNTELDEFVAYFDGLPNFPKPYFHEAAGQVRTAISPRLLSSASTHIGQQLTDGTRVTFRLLSQQMPSDGAPVDADELEELLNLIAQLRAALEHSSLSLRLRLLIERQLRLLMRAVDAYPIRGSRAFQDSFSDMSGELMAFLIEAKEDSTGEASAALQTKEVSILFNAASKLRTIAAKIGNLRPYVQLAADTVKLIHELKHGGGDTPNSP